jgi:hypothetical protein
LKYPKPVVLWKWKKHTTQLKAPFLGLKGIINQMLRMVPTGSTY